MTLEEAIKYAENMVFLSHRGSGNDECEQNHRQLAEWLKDYKRLLEQDPCENDISREDALMALTGEWTDSTDELIHKFIRRIRTLPSVTPQPKRGRWMPIEYDGYADGYPVWDKWECSECGWEHSGDKESLTAFCPNCGTKMEVEDNG